MENLSFSSDYLVISALFSLASALFPLVFHIRSTAAAAGGVGGDVPTALFDGAGGWEGFLSFDVLSQCFDGAFGRSWKERILILT